MFDEVARSYARVGDNAVNFSRSVKCPVKPFDGEEML